MTHSDPDTQKKAKKRRFAIVELCQTEIRYCRDIKVLELDILLPLSNLLRKSSSSIAIAALGPVDRILAALRNIRSLNRILRRSLRNRIPPEALSDTAQQSSSSVEPLESDGEDLAAMEEVKESGVDEVGPVNLWSIASVFQQITPFLKFYTTYIAQFEKVTECLADCRRTSRSTRKINEGISEIESNPSLRGLDVSSFLIMPVQRVPRYRLLLEAVLKQTPMEHPDFEGVFSALEAVKAVANGVNEKLKEWEDRLKIIDIERQLTFGMGVDSSSIPKLIQPHRRLIKEGFLKKLSRRGTLQPKRVILFNDLLMYCGGKNLWTFGRYFESWFVTDDASGSGFDFGFTIHTSDKTFTLYAEAQSIVEEWRGLLENLARAHVGLRGLAAAVWKPDTSTQVCPGCGVGFNLLRRRHHCRACGEVYCSSCTQWRMILRTETVPSRVCQKCKKDAEERRAVTSSTSCRLSKMIGSDKDRSSMDIAAPPGVSLSILSYGNEDVFDHQFDFHSDSD
ncbi:hypothetical protein P9112_012497 [Eukaryota sp. TZLM1-RC]